LRRSAIRDGGSGRGHAMRSESFDREPGKLAEFAHAILLAILL
jgi:hypothetical protein